MLYSCDRTTLKMRGLLPQNQLGDLGEARMHKHTHQALNYHKWSESSVITTYVYSLWNRVVEGVSKDRMFLRKHSSQRYKDIHLTLEVKTFIDNLHQWWVPVRGPALRSLDLPLITTINITKSKRGITCTQGINRAKLERLRSVRLTQHD
jgi:hypothetical protein